MMAMSTGVIVAMALMGMVITTMMVLVITRLFIVMTIAFSHWRWWL